MVPVVVVVLAIAAAVLWEPMADWAFRQVATATGDAVQVTMPLCSGSRDRYNCIVDGDTLHLNGETIRIADIDAPEVRDYNCAEEKALGDAATRRLRQLVNAGPFIVARTGRDTDKYGRSLRILLRDGKSLGMQLVAEGLAQRWGPGYYPWC